MSYPRGIQPEIGVERPSLRACLHRGKVTPVPAVTVLARLKHSLPLHGWAIMVRHHVGQAITRAFLIGLHTEISWGKL